MRKQLMWGLLLVGLGGTLLLDQLGMLDVYDFWHDWPLLLVVLGINKMIGYPTARDFTSGLWTAFIGVWLFANFEDMFGMTFRNSWPYLIIAWGITSAPGRWCSKARSRSWQRSASAWCWRRPAGPGSAPPGTRCGNWRGRAGPGSN